MQRYDRYKDSGIEWIEEIPEGWEVKKLRFSFNLTKGLTITKANLKSSGIPCVNYGEIHSRYGFEVIPERDELKYVDKSYLETSNQALLGRGDFVFADTSEDTEGSGNFTHLHSDTNIFAGYHTIIARLKVDMNYRYIAYFFESVAFRNQVRQQVKGVKVYSITNAILKDTLIFLPPKEEQISIAKYLTKKTTEIDELIAQKEKLLVLYEEEKAAVINQAVTKGVDSGVTMKESGVPWLGEIPEHWEVIPVKYALEIPITDGPHETPEILNIGIPFLSAEAVKNDKLDFDKKRGYISQEDHERFTMKYKPKIGDVYMVKSGATTGNLAKVETEEEFSIWSPLAALRPKKDFMTTDFLFYFMKSKSFFHSVVLGWNYGTQQNIGMGVIANLKITHPPEEEQKLIVKYIIKELSIISKKTKKTKKIIALQKEYRTALISEVVTGEIKVPEEI